MNSLFQKLQFKTLVLRLNKNYSTTRLVNKEKQAFDELTQEKINAFKNRIEIPFTNEKVIFQALTHKSYDHARVPTNERFEWLGKRVLNMYVGEFLEDSFPDLNAEQIQDLSQVYFGERKLSDISRKLGMQYMVRWKSHSYNSPAEGNHGESKVLGKAFQALVGAIYSDQGSKAARDFTRKHLFDQPINISLVMELDQPKRRLLGITTRKNLQEPISRVLKETGMFTPVPYYVVGIFINDKKVGEGFGDSIESAESKAAKDALIRNYTNEDRSFDLETQVEQPENKITFFSSGLE
ncbi:hypothetical protein BB558_007642 [Smittium angustum]|uniref:Large ribosomal subunit protein mL44 n=1 Tax=Smittium angustum TaxID=133377 RepID=A0A2U1IUI5_SMIAN|nr:hypothetical protein BB558_007642 [Smittium angustum]